MNDSFLRGKKREIIDFFAMFVPNKCKDTDNSILCLYVLKIIKL